MSRKNKIIVSIVGVTIVLLALLGLTYGYYLTRIQGNTNTTSISITTADLKLEYAEGEDSNISLSGLMPGQDIPAKTFTVTNSGNGRVDNYVVAIIDLVNTLSRTEDLTYTLTCTEYDEDDEEVGSCNGVSKVSGTEFGPIYPNKNSMIVTNSIEPDYTHEYSLKLNYENLPDVNQSVDMGSIIRGKVQIYGLADTIDLTGTVTGASEGDYVQINSEKMVSEIVDGTYTLVGIEPGTHSLKIMDKDGVKKTEKYIQINNGQIASTGTTDIEIEDETVTVPLITMTQTSRIATININKTTQNYDLEEEITEYVPEEPELTESQKTLAALGLTVSSGTPDFSKTSCSSGCEESTVGIYAAPDNYGTSYYFRGDVENNNVLFGQYPNEDIYCYVDGELEKQCFFTENNCVLEMNEDVSIIPGDTECELDEEMTNTYKNKELHGKIIRINGDGTLRLISNEIVDNFYSLFYKTIIKDEFFNYVLPSMFCEDKTIASSSRLEIEDGLWEGYDIYAASQRIENNSPSLVCPENEIKTKKIGLISADEVIFAGGGLQSNASYYLNNGNKYLLGTPESYNYYDAWYSQYAINSDGTLIAVEEPEHEEFSYLQVINLTKEYARTLKLNSDGIYVAN